jgi:S1-C subfamily serine protease
MKNPKSKTQIPTAESEPAASEQSSASAPKPSDFGFRISNLIIVAALLAATGGVHAAPADASVPKLVSVVRVNATNQAWDFFHPWTKHAPYSHRGLGAVLDHGEVLVTAELIENANYVELERAESGERVPATVEAVDYEADLALLKPADDHFLNGITPLELTDAGVGDHLAVWQLEVTGALLITDALLTTVEVGRYPEEDVQLLDYSLTTSLQYRDGSFTLPIVKGGKLAGLLMRYDTRTQNANAIPAAVIEHFLRDADGKSYGGFPRAGLLFSPARDPQLRQYAKIPATIPGGVYVTHVERGSPGEEAGIKPGDILLAVAGKSVDQDGNYTDPRRGKLSLINLISLQTAGSKVPFKLLRDGKAVDIEVTVRHRAADSYVIPPYVIGRAPNYYVLGGLVLQELSREYLKEWGSDWQKKAPERMVYYDRYQSDLFQGDRKHLVILSQVLPTADTIGYEDLGALVVTKINDLPLNSFADVSKALEHPVNGFDKIEFEENPTVIYLDAEQVSEHTEDMQKTYGLPAISRAE